MEDVVAEGPGLKLYPVGGDGGVIGAGDQGGVDVLGGLGWFSLVIVCESRSVRKVRKGLGEQ